MPHLPAWNAGFTYDDRDFVEQNATLHSLGQALNAFLSPFPKDDPKRGLYRPITLLSYALDRAVGGPKPAIYHRTNLLYYALTVLLLFALLRRWLPGPDPLRRWAAALGTLFFAIHPVHAEAVDSISGRSELLALLFALGALILFDRFLKQTHGMRRYLCLGLSALLVLLAALSKKTGAVTPGVMLIAILLRGGHRKRWAALLPSTIALALYVMMRLDALSGAFTPSKTILGSSSFGAQLNTIGIVINEYARLLVAPTTLQVDLCYERMIGVQHTTSIASFAGLTLLLLLILAWLSLLRRALRIPTPTTHATLLGLSVLLLYLFPVSHVIPFGALMAERLIYAPSAGFSIVIAVATLALLARTRGHQRHRVLVVTLAGVIVLLLATRTTLRAREWHDPITL